MEPKRRQESQKYNGAQEEMERKTYVKEKWWFHIRQEDSLIRPQTQHGYLHKPSHGNP
jgi:hypothetical protein